MIHGLLVGFHVNNQTIQCNTKILQGTTLLKKPTGQVLHN